MMNPDLVVPVVKVAALSADAVHGAMSAKLALVGDAGSHVPLFQDVFPSERLTNVVWNFAQMASDRCMPDLVTGTEAVASRPLPQHLALGIRIPPIEPRIPLPLPRIPLGLDPGTIGNGPVPIPLPTPSAATPPPVPQTTAPLAHLDAAIDKARDGYSNLQMAMMLTATNVSSYFFGRRRR